MPKLSLQRILARDLTTKHQLFRRFRCSTDIQPQTILSGDDNFVIGGVPVKSGLLELSMDAPISWTAARHKFVGNIFLPTARFSKLRRMDCKQALQKTGIATNRLAIP
jgi:hypothetical protein